MNLFTLPISTEFKRAGNVLIAGAGGGFDVFSGLPLYFALRDSGKQVHLANLSFSNLPPETAGRHLTPELVEVTADSVGSANYFPEKHLSAWFREMGREVPVYAIHRVGARPVIDAYRALAKHLAFDAVILVDGGTDSLMRGDEHGLGTPQEDIASLVAAHALVDVPTKLLVCLGFGVDHFHGVSHADVLEAVADLSRVGGFLGAFSLLSEMPEVKLYASALQYVLARTPDRASIVSTSIVSAIEGHYGDHHATDRTVGSELYINPLMSMYWSFRLDAVARRNLYLDRIRATEGYLDLVRAIEGFRDRLPMRKPFRKIPL